MTPAHSKKRNSPKTPASTPTSPPAALDSKNMVTGPILKFTVPGTPHSKHRPRFTTRSGKVTTYTPRATQQAEQKIVAAWRAAGGKPSLNPHTNYGITVSFNLINNHRRDLDNMLKTVLDALNKRAWADDTQVVKITAQKIIHNNQTTPNTEITIYPITQ